MTPASRGSRIGSLQLRTASPPRKPVPRSLAIHHSSIHSRMLTIEKPFWCHLGFVLMAASDSIWRERQASHEIIDSRTFMTAIRAPRASLPREAHVNDFTYTPARPVVNSPIRHGVYQRKNGFQRDTEGAHRSDERVVNAD